MYRRGEGGGAAGVEVCLRSGGLEKIKNDMNSFCIGERQSIQSKCQIENTWLSFINMNSAMVLVAR